MDLNDRIERLAELEGKAAKAAHDIWAHWMKYMFTQGKYQQSNFVISFENVARWQRQMMTEFKDLLPQEQKSDFEIADHFIAPLLREMAQALSEAQAENERLKADAERTDKAFSKALKDLVLAKRESKRFGNQVVLAVNKGCELQAENQRLREGIGRAVDCLRRDCESFGELSSAVCDAQEQLEALHDA